MHQCQSEGPFVAGFPRLSTSINRAPMGSVNGKLPPLSGHTYCPAFM